MKLETLADSHGYAYPFVLRAGPWKVGDHVAYTTESIRQAIADKATRRKWRGVILSCSGNPETPTGRASFLVLDPTGEVFYQHPYFLRKLGR